jgi:hypothetical protein
MLWNHHTVRGAFRLGCLANKDRPCHRVQVRRGLTEGNYTLDSRHFERLWRGPFVAGHCYLPLTTEHTSRDYSYAR